MGQQTQNSQRQLVVDRKVTMYNARRTWPQKRVSVISIQNKTKMPAWFRPTSKNERIYSKISGGRASRDCCGQRTTRSVSDLTTHEAKYPHPKLYVQYVQVKQIPRGSLDSYRSGCGVAQRAEEFQILGQHSTKPSVFSIFSKVPRLFSLTIMIVRAVNRNDVNDTSTS